MEREEQIALASRVLVVGMCIFGDDLTVSYSYASSGAGTRVRGGLTVQVPMVGNLRWSPTARELEVRSG